MPDLSRRARAVVILFGIAAGFGALAAHIKITDYPIDMIVYREGVWSLLDGRPVYTQPMVVGDLRLPFIYPPFAALALTPFAQPWMVHDFAGDALIVVSAALLLACLYLVARAVLPSQRADWVWPAAAVAWPLGLVMEPVALNDSFGQINVILMALVVLDLVPRRRFLPQGWLIGLAIAIKLTPLAMLLYFLLRRDLRSIAVAVGTAAAVTAATAAVYWEPTKSFFTDTLFTMGAGGEFGVDPSYQSNSSIKAMLLRWFSSAEASDAATGLVNALWLVLSLLMILAGAWVMIRLLRRSYDTEAWLVNALVMLAISPVSWSHHFVWLAILLPVLLWRALSQQQVEWPLAGAAGLWLLAVVTNPPKWWYEDGMDTHTGSLLDKVLMSDYLWLSLLVMAATWWWTRRQAGAAPGSGGPVPSSGD